jgi:Flp pilus assembly protein TadG
MKGCSCRRGSRGSVLMLMPAGFLIVLMLAAVSFDLSLLFLRQRQASAVATDIANDVASAALDTDRYRSTGTFALDPERADDLAASYAESSDVGGLLLELDVEVPDEETVRVTVTLGVDYVFARAIPGAAEGTTVTASATAVAATG